MTAVLIPRRYRKPYTTMAVVRNGSGFAPDADVMAFLQEQVNQIVAWRTKSWNHGCPLSAVPAAGGAGNRTRWRGAFHTSPKCRYLWVRVVAAPTGASTNARTLVTFSLLGSGLEDCRATFTEGVGVTSLTVVPDNLRVGEVQTTNSGGLTLVEVDPDTDYQYTVTDVDNARTVAVSIWEETQENDTDNGYLLGAFSAGQPIFDTHRELMTELMREAYLSQAAPLWNWSSNTDAAAITRSSATIANLLDTSITGSPTAASPGATLDLRYRNRLSSTTVPCVFAVHGKVSNVAGNGHVYLTDSTGTDLADIEIDDTTEQWTTATVNLPATLAKYDLRINGDGTHTTTVYAAALWQYAAP